MAARLWAISSLAVFLVLVGFALRAEEPGLPPDVVPPRIVQAINEQQLTALKGNTHRLARAQFDRGPAPPDLPMERMLLVLKRSDDQERALRKLLDDQQDKAPPQYHKWVTPEEFGKKFGPANQDMQVVTGWLESHGFSIGRVAKGRNMIEFSGTAAQVKEALHTSIHKYVVNGEEHWANANDPQIPTALTPVVAGVHTLHNFLKKPMLHYSQEKVAAKLEGKPPHVTFPGNPAVHALGPADFATIYNINPLYKAGVSGKGSSIAVIARSDPWSGRTDVGDFNNIFGLCCSGGSIVVNGPDPGDLGGGEEIEATLDATWPIAVAPNVTEYFVVSATTNTTDGVDLSELYNIDNNLAGIMTESFGDCEANFTSTEAQGYATLAEQAAAQGITYLVSTGDSGAEGCDDPNTETVASGPLSVNVLASTPYTVAVGGTMFNENGQDSKYWSSNNQQGTLQSVLSYIPEDVWNESCLASQCGQNAGIWAGSGGFSTFFTKPSWQTGVKGIPNDGARDIPDVSLTAASHDPYLLCVEGSCEPDDQGNFFVYFVAGTSASAPSFAGIMALVDQKMSARQGQADYVLYKLAAGENLAQCNASNTTTLPASACIFNDATVGNNAVPGEANYGNSKAQYQSSVGFDLATGLGSVNVTNLVNKWNTVNFNPTTTTIVSLSPISITHGQPVAADITVTSSKGTPTGGISLLTGGGEAVGIFPLTNGEFNDQITSLPGGTYQLTAQYGGDGTFGPSTSQPSAQVTVTAEPSTTTLAVLGYPNQNGFPAFTSGPYGSFVYLRADAAGQSGFGTATGNVDFLDNGVPIPEGPYFLNSQGNTATPNGIFIFNAGLHSMVAHYEGDFSFNASTSAPVNFTITQASTKTTAGSAGEALYATINTASGGFGPTGTVTFIVDGAQAGDPVPISLHYQGVIDPLTDKVITGASAIANTTVAKAPTIGFKAIYNGDTNYTGSTSPVAPDFALTAGSPTLTVNAGSASFIYLTITAMDGFVGAIQLSSSSCTGLPSESSCSFSPSKFIGGGVTTLTISTTAPKVALLIPHGPIWWTSGAGLFAVIVLAAPSNRRRRNRMLSLIVLGTVMMLPSCGGGSSSGGGGSSDPGTPQGSYPVVVTATSGALKHTVTFTLKVQ